MVDQRRLRAEAWTAYHTARKALDKALRDLQRHETVDVPEYEAWLHRTFPVLLTALRRLEDELGPKIARVRAVQAQAAMFGGSLKRIWREFKKREANPEPAEEEFDSEARQRRADDEEASDWEHSEPDEASEPAAGPAPNRAAREIYRRLVQRLHPDRGGEWTAARARLWHQVQEAWAAADADWLARLEVEWETANEVLGPASSLSRIRRAVVELRAAKRDADRKLQGYREVPAWRFSKTERKRGQLRERVEGILRSDFEHLRRQLDFINDTIARWEEDWTRARPRRR